MLQTPQHFCGLCCSSTTSLLLTLNNSTFSVPGEGRVGHPALDNTSITSQSQQVFLQQSQSLGKTNPHSEHNSVSPISPRGQQSTAEYKSQHFLAVSTISHIDQALSWLPSPLCPPQLTFGPGSAGLGAAAAQCGRDDLGGQVQIIPQVLDALVGQVPVEVSPGKLLLHVSSGLERLRGELPVIPSYG